MMAAKMKTFRQLFESLYIPRIIALAAQLLQTPTFTDPDSLQLCLQTLSIFFVHPCFATGTVPHSPRMLLRFCSELLCMTHLFSPHLWKQVRI